MEPTVAHVMVYIGALTVTNGDDPYMPVFWDASPFVLGLI